MNTIPSVAKTASVVDLFCGAGGLSFGFKTTGFDVTAGVDIDEVCRYPYESNVGAPFIRCDVASMSHERLEDLFAPNRRKVLVGCAPCQPFSTYNQKNENPSWRLLSSFSDLIRAVRPDVVSMENVPRLLNFKGGSIFSDFTHVLEDDGYHVAHDILFAPDYGLPQNRSRLVLLASRLGPIALPKPTHETRHRTVRDALSDLPPLEAGGTDPADSLHRSSRLSDINVRRIKSARPGGSWKDWRAELVAQCHQDETGKGYAAVYGRMEWDKPAPTITTQFFGFGSGRFGHPDQDRGISLREGAILQGFPRDYRFVSPADPVHMKTVGRLIGNAVPVMLAEAIAKSVAIHLKECGGVR